MVKNQTSTNLLFVGFCLWVSAVLLMPFSQTSYFMLTAAAIAVFLAAIAMGVVLKRAEHGS